MSLRKLRLLIAEPEGLSEKATRLLKQHFRVAVLEGADRASLLERISGFDAVFTRLGFRFDREVLDRAQTLKFLATPTTGLNHIDLIAANQKSIRVLSLKGEVDFLRNVTATAELSWGLTLALVRKLYPAVSHTRELGWDRMRFRGHELSGRTLGVVGYGRLGAIVSEYGKAFRMKVVVNDTRPLGKSCEFRVLSFPELLMESDVVSIHVDLNESSKGLFDSQAFALMKPTAVLINTSRGEVIVESALIEALKGKKIGGAALDVLSNEVETGKVWAFDGEVLRYASTCENLIVTPHIGGATYESLDKAEEFLAHRLVDHVRGLGDSLP